MGRVRCAKEYPDAPAGGSRACTVGRPGTLAPLLGHLASALLHAVKLFAVIDLPWRRAIT